jgi:4-oxalocrotonate tautomerase family enzyme
LVPIVHVLFVDGPSTERQRELQVDLTDAVVARFGVPRESVAVVLQSIPADAWAAGGVPVSELRRTGT